ncbi:MAG: hypothetical protein AAGJ81_06020 [Verrucomicrobiota bacterium]
MKLPIASSLLVLLLFSASQAASVDAGQLETTSRSDILDRYYDDIRDLPFNYRNVGSVLEAIAYLQLREEFPPPDFIVLANLVYWDGNGRTLGEIDLLVINVAENRVQIVYEVKMTASPVYAGRIARRQLRRLQAALLDESVAGFSDSFPDYSVEATLFDTDTEYRLLGGTETIEFDWDRSLDLTREEGDFLQERILGR